MGTVDHSIVFCNSVTNVEFLTKKMAKLGYSTSYIHAKLCQADRNRIFYHFRNGYCHILVSSDLFSRGIDVQAVDTVVNCDLPDLSKTYLHRIGRSGRFGHRSIVISLVTPEEKLNLTKIQHELSIEIKPIPYSLNQTFGYQ